MFGKNSDNESFSAVIESGVDELSKIIISIMLDIALYHYFKLPNNLLYRQSFGIVKKEFLEDSLSRTEMRSIYGSSFNSRKDIRYLSISSLFIDNIYENPEAITELLKTFTRFYYKHVIGSVLVDINNNYIKLDKSFPVDDDEKAKEILDNLTDNEKNEIIEEYKNLSLARDSMGTSASREDKIILLLYDEAIFTFQNTKKRKFFMEINMEPETYINLADVYMLFRVDVSDVDEV